MSSECKKSIESRIVNTLAWMPQIKGNVTCRSRVHLGAQLVWRIWWSECYILTCNCRSWKKILTRRVEASSQHSLPWYQPTMSHPSLKQQDGLCQTYGSLPGVTFWMQLPQEGRGAGPTEHMQHDKDLNSLSWTAL